MRGRRASARNCRRGRRERASLELLQTCWVILKLRGGAAALAGYHDKTSKRVLVRLHGMEAAVFAQKRVAGRLHGMAAASMADADAVAVRSFDK